MSFIVELWYQKKIHPLLWPLIPLALLVSLYSRIRYFIYKKNGIKIKTFPVPIVVVGNLTVGGTGKTPLVIHLAKLFTQHGFKPGVVSRGYGGTLKEIQKVHAKSSPKEVGDEPLLLAKRLFCPIYIGANRSLAIEQCLSENSVDVIITDDGLQHYTMPHTIEIVVIDGKRRFGNGWCLPAGPLREPLSRLSDVDFCVVNTPNNYLDQEYEMELRPRFIANGLNPSDQKTLAFFQGQKVHAVAGIGFPERFFTLLRNYGLIVIPHSFPDHYQFQARDLEFIDDLPVLMTEKDAVKCENFMQEKYWVLSVDAMLNPLFDARVVNKLKEFRYG